MKLLEKIQAGKPYFIAEMSANHAGSLQNALDIVRAAAAAGADCVKIQTYTADTMTLNCENEYFKIHGGLWDGYKLYDLYSEAMTPWEWHKPIMREAQEAGIDFLSTPFDRSSVDFLAEMDVGAYKIASFEITDLPLLHYAARRGKPMLISTGMARASEIAEAVDAIRAEGNNSIVLLKCTSEYPARAEDMNLAAIPDMADVFGLPVGLSDHSLGSGAAVAACLLGARVIEKHFCLSRGIKNPDSAFSMEPDEFAAMVQDVQAALDMMGSALYGPSGAEAASLKFRRSIFAACDIEAGEDFSAENIRVVRPSDGLAPRYYPQLIGTKCARFISRGQPLSEEHVCIKLK